MVFFAELLPDDMAAFVLALFLGCDVPGIEQAGLRVQIGRFRTL
jgi:hypothetical protein